MSLVVPFEVPSRGKFSPSSVCYAKNNFMHLKHNIHEVETFSLMNNPLWTMTNQYTYNDSQGNNAGVHLQKACISAKSALGLS